MERVLLWASVVAGILVYICRFLPTASRGADRTAAPPGTSGPPPLHPTLRAVALAAPLLGWALTLPGGSGFFGEGQRLGLGFLLGGAGALIAALPILSGRRSEDALGALASLLGVGAAVVALALLFLRASIHDALAGVAIGWFATTFPLLLALPIAERTGRIGRSLAAGAGITVTLATAATLGVFRDPLTPELAKLTWSAAMTGFAALGALFVAGAALVPGVPAPARRVLPLFALLLGGGLALFQMSVKIAGEPRLLYVGLGGMLLWPVAQALLRYGLLRGRLLSPATPAFAVPALAILVVASGFLAALQLLQGVGVAAFTVGLWLAVAATATSEEDSETVSALSTGAVALALFATVLLLWRVFVTRWAGELRGMTLSDQYALFGLLVGAALPSLLAAAPEKWRGGNRGGATPALLTLLWCALLASVAPVAALLLFGPKSAAALLIGLALGAVQALAGRTSLMPATLALAVALVLEQFTGKVLGAMSDDMTRVERLRWLAGLVAAAAVLVVATDRISAAQDDSATAVEEAE